MVRSEDDREGVWLVRAGGRRCPGSGKDEPDYKVSQGVIRCQVSEDKLSNLVV